MAEPFGPYELVKRLGGGGMGEVFLARQRGPSGFEKLLVVKTLHAHLAEDDEFKAMFLDEARLAAALIHPNVCQVLDVGEVDGTLYMAMEYVAGDELRAIAATARRLSKPIPPALCARIIAEAAAGLHFAHTAANTAGEPLHIIHRDVSPQNILVTYEGGVKVIDFGVAKAAGRATQTRTGTLKGKYAYMSPEQVAADKDLDARSDVFALGVVLWEMLTGKRLFKAESEMATLARVSAAEVEPPSRAAAGLPADLDPIVLQALARGREERYSSAEALHLALEGWITEAKALASRAHLAAFVREVYAEKWEQYSRRGPLADAPPPDQPVRGSRTPTPAVRFVPAAPPRTELGPGDVVSVKQLAPAPPTAARPWLSAGAAAFGALVLAGVAWVATRPAKAPATESASGTATGTEIAAGPGTAPATGAVAESLTEPAAAPAVAPEPALAKPPPQTAANPSPPRATKPAATSPPSGDTASGLIDLNRATAAELESLPGIGPSKARAILAWREKNGPFTSVDQLDEVKGIGPAIMVKLRPLVKVEASRSEP